MGSFCFEGVEGWGGLGGLMGGMGLGGLMGLMGVDGLWDLGAGAWSRLKICLNSICEAPSNSNEWLWSLTTFHG